KSETSSDDNVCHRRSAAVARTGWAFPYQCASVMLMPAELLEVEDLTIRFHPGGPVVVDGLSISLTQGETLSLVGESGCGKSLTALAIIGLLPPGARTTGRVRLEGEDLLAAGERHLADLRGNRLAMIDRKSVGVGKACGGRWGPGGW